MLKISKSDLRMFARMLLFTESNVANVADVVDPNALVTDPLDDDRRPQNTRDLKLGLSQQLDGVPDREASDTYEAIEGALDALRDKRGENHIENAKEDEDKEERESLQDKQEEQQKMSTESKLRATIQKIIKEGIFDAPPPKINRKRPQLINNTGTGKAGKRKYTATKDQEGASLQDIAADLGGSVSGARRVVEWALKKFNFLMSLDPEEVDEIVDEGVDDYVKELESSGELTPEEVADLKANTDALMTLDGFKEFLHGYIRSAAKERGILF
jgi:hypothetical protein